MNPNAWRDSSEGLRANRWWCAPCQAYTSVEHEVVMEREFGRQEPVSVYCETTGMSRDLTRVTMGELDDLRKMLVSNAERPNSRSKGVSEEDMEYVRKSLGVE